MLNTQAGRFYRLLEPVSAAVFYAPETTASFAQLDLDPTSGYVMSRAAPMGRPSPDLVSAVFYSFHPSMIHANVKWEVADPSAVLDARVRAARDAMRRLIPDPVPDELIGALRRSIEATDMAGRPLAAAHAALPWPADAHTALWHAATVLREHRGDGHNAVLVAHGVPPAEAIVLDAAFTASKPDAYYAFRGFPRVETDAARDRLRQRMYLDDAGALTDGGGKFRQMLEMETDRLAGAPYEALSSSERDGAAVALEPIVKNICAGRNVPRFIAALAGLAS